MPRAGGPRAAAFAVAAVAVTLLAGATMPATAEAGRGTAVGDRSSGVGAVTDAGVGQEESRVTLITGDQVLLDRDGQPVGLIRAEGRQSVPFHIRKAGAGEHAQVIPADVQPLLAKGTLDERLFDVTELSRPEYRRTGGLPLIIGYEGEGADERPRALARTAAEGTYLDAIDADAVTATDKELPAIWSALTDPANGVSALTAAPGISSVALDAVVEKTLAESVPQIGAPAVWESGYDGTGTTIAIVDTGISDSHPDLKGKVVAEQNFSDAPDAEDRDGHGTHVASTAAGTGAQSGGKYKGVAPGAKLINAKVLNDTGGGSVSGVIRGMQWAVEQGADVINLSLGGPATDTIDPLERAVDTLSAQSDSLFVISAGNEGPDTSTLGSPGTADAALTVGAVDKSDALAGFSSVGPRLRDNGIKPDVTAPGVGIGAAGAEGARIWQYGTPVEGAEGYVALDGTSMAAPHATGAAALLAQAHPDWNSDKIKAALTSSAEQSEGYTAFQQGAGRIDVSAALEQTVTTEQVSLNFGLVQWPHADAEPVVRDLTYANSGDTDVTLSLDVKGTDPKGAPAPEDMFTLSADQVTVPAGGTATVQASADTTPGGEVYGAYSSYVTATAADGRTVATAGAVIRQERYYEVSIETLDRTGAPTEDWWGTLQNLETKEHYGFGDSGGSTGGRTKVRVPEGEYNLDLVVYQGDGVKYTAVDWLVRPSFTLNNDLKVDADARKAALIDYTMPVENAEHRDLTVGYRVAKGGETYLNSFFSMANPVDNTRTAQLAEPGDDWTLSSYVGARWEAGDVDYNGADAREGAFYTGLTKHVRRSQLAKVSTTEGASLRGMTGQVLTLSSDVRFATGRDYALPRTAENFVEAGTGTWYQDLWQFSPGGFLASHSTTDAQAYKAGRKYQERINVGVFGPAIREGSGLTRTGNVLRGEIAPFTDGDGNWGVSSYASASTTLYRDGKEFATAEGVLDEVEFEVPAEKARYELVTTVRRDPAAKDAAASVSTEITTAFGFTSAAGAGEGPVAVPASVVRFTPKLALDSTAAAGRTAWVPFTVQGTAAKGRVESLKVSVSTDGGKTWKKAAVKKNKVKVTNPAAGGSVSFRAELEDRRGNTTVLTIIDAYRTA